MLRTCSYNTTQLLDIVVAVVDTNFIANISQPSELRTKPESPHCLHITWKRPLSDCVTGYNIYCFLGDSQKAEIVKHISNVSQESAIISGLKPDQIYRVGITSVCSGTESKHLFSAEHTRMRKFIINRECH